MGGEQKNMLKTQSTYLDPPRGVYKYSLLEFYNRLLEGPRVRPAFSFFRGVQTMIPKYRRLLQETQTGWYWWSCHLKEESQRPLRSFMRMM